MKGERTQDSQARSQRRGGMTGVVQLVIAAIAGFFAWRLRAAAITDENSLGAGFWGLIALMVFCAAFALFNLLLPLVRSSFGEPIDERQRLSRRLSPAGGNWEVTRELFGLGLAFFTPVIPLAIMALRMSQADNDFTLLGVGATLVCLVASGIMLLLTTGNLYTMVVAGRTLVEIDARSLEAGTNVPVFVSYEPGRLVPRNIRLRVVCRDSGRGILLPERQRRFGSRRVTVLELYTADICQQAMSDTAVWPWECMASFVLPDDARPSSTEQQTGSPIAQRHIIDWSLELIVDVAMAPNFRIGFPIKVV